MRVLGVALGKPDSCRVRLESNAHPFPCLAPCVHIPRHPGHLDVTQPVPFDAATTSPSPSTRSLVECSILLHGTLTLRSRTRPSSGLALLSRNAGTTSSGKSTTPLLQRQRLPRPPRPPQPRHPPWRLPALWTYRRGLSCPRKQPRSPLGGVPLVPLRPRLALGLRRRFWPLPGQSSAIQRSHAGGAAILPRSWWLPSSPSLLPVHPYSSPPLEVRSPD